MQNYSPISATDNVSNGPTVINHNTDTVLSCSSGTAFPTTNLQVGMLCFRTDQSKLYQLHDATPTWILLLDVSGATATALASKLATPVNIAGVSFDGSAGISIPFANLSSKPTTLGGYGITDAYSSSNPSGFISGINSSMVVNALGYTPYNNSNPSGFISGINSSMVQGVTGAVANVFGFGAAAGGVTGSARIAADTSNNTEYAVSAWNHQTFGGAIVARIESTSARIMTIFGGTSQGGSITTDGSTTSYNTTSDYRRKTNVRAFVGGLDAVMRLKPCVFDWREAGIGEDPILNTQGFLAHEVAAVYDQAVHGEKDAVDDDGAPIWQSMDHAKLVPMMVAAIQELKADFDAYVAAHP